MSLISRGLGFSRNLLLRGLGNSINEEPVNNYFTVSELNIESNVKTNKYFYPLTGIYSENENVSGWNFSRAIPQDLNSIYERIENSLGGYKNNLEEGTIRNDWKGAVVDSIKLKKIEEKYKKFNRSIWEPILETGTYSIYWFEKYLFSDYSSSILLESKTKQVVIEDGDEDIVVNEIVYTTEIPYGASNISIQNFKRDNYFVNIPYLKYVYDENFENNYSYSVEEIEEISVITVNNYYEKVIGISKQEIESNYNSNNSLIENFEFAGIGTENRSIIYTEFFPIKDVILIEEKKDPEGNTSIEFWEEGEFDYSSSSKKFIVDKFNGKININNSIEKEFYVKKYIEEEKCIEFFKELDLGNSDKGYVKINDVRYQYSNGSNFKIYLITEENLNLNVGEKIVFPQKGSNFSQGSNLWIGYKNIPRVDFEFSENERRGIADLKPYRKVDSSGILEINPYEKHISKLTLEAEMQLEGNMYKTLYMGVDDVKLTAKAVNSHGTPVKENAIDFYCDYGDFSRNSSLTNQNGEATTYYYWGYNEKDSCTFLEKLEYINGSTVIKIPSRNNYVININTNIFQVTKDDPFYGSLGWETNIKNASFENNYWHIELKENLPNLEEYFSNQMLYNEYQSLSTRNDFEDFFSIHSCQELLVNYCLGYIKNNNRIIKIIVDKVVDKNIIAIKADYFGGQIIDLRDKEIVLYKRNEMVFSRENVLNGFSQDRIMYEDNGLQLVPIRPNNIFLHEGNTNIVYINKILPQSDIYDESNIVAGYKIYTDKIANIYAEVTDPASGKRVRSNTIKILVSLPEYLKGESGFKLKEEEFGKESGIGGSNFLTVNEIEAQNEYNNAVDEIITINPFYKNRINFFVQNEVAQ